ncbi:hypothetical protein SKAU_G00199550 [Synaphobranchus kaupii]|uniref:Uncharacterized protein n=1 Tax=Synaphobranchus kaupii TaxID=118154 RepID=A0A9Q1IXQ0_SYNKA|nr:hypothetical protein SKAU_G00199550 [Synaphobranchus kaupii]
MVGSLMSVDSVHSAFGVWRVADIGKEAGLFCSAEPSKSSTNHVSQCHLQHVSKFPSSAPSLNSVSTLPAPPTIPPLAHAFNLSSIQPHLQPIPIHWPYPKFD